MTKKELAEKIAKEQNLDAVKLMRLTVAELEKMDIVVPDTKIVDVEGNEVHVEDNGNLVIEDVDIFDGVELEEDSQEEDPSDVVVEETKKPLEGKKLIGLHPITKEPVYK